MLFVLACVYKVWSKYVYNDICTNLISIKIPTCKLANIIVAFDKKIHSLVNCKLKPQTRQNIKKSSHLSFKTYISFFHTICRSMSINSYFSYTHHLSDYCTNLPNCFRSHYNSFLQFSAPSDICF